MKKIVGIILGMLLVSGIASAQKFDLGVKGGYMYSDMDVHSVKEMKSKAKSGYLLGVFARVSGDKWFFQPELQYRARTSDFTFEDAVKGKVAVDCKTLDMPLQVGINLLNLQVVKISAHTGPVVSLNLNDDTELRDIPGNLDDYVKDYKSVLWAGQVGVSVDFMRFVIDLSYEKGFTELADKGAGKNDLFMATLGVKLF